MKTISEIRPSPISGHWYSANPLSLTKSIDDYLAAATIPQIKGKVIALMVPHAGHVYSGPVAAYAFKAVSGMQFDRVAVVSPMHAFHPDSLLTSAHKAYSTPLGVIPVDKKAIAEVDEIVNAELGFGLTPVAYDTEHSVEIELPFLQRVLGGPFQLLPIMMRDQTPLVSQVLGHALAKVLAGQSVLLVASTDLSHFYPQFQAEAFDQAFLDAVASFSPGDLFELEAQGNGFACGLAPLAAVLWAAADLGADRVEILNHGTSGDITGDLSSVVGYGAGVILKEEKN